MAIPATRLGEMVTLLQSLTAPVKYETPLTFEDLKQDYGYVLYRTQMDGGKSGMFKLQQLRDYAIVMINGKTVATLDRRLKQDSMQLSLPQGRVTVDILVENMGRINFGKYLLQNKKGITQRVLFDNIEVKNWQMFSLPFSSTQAFKFKAGAQTAGNAPVLRKGTFTLNTIADTYLDMRAWGKGVVWVNGHNLGKYWSIGPQQTLYLPAEWLKKGANNIVVLELLKPQQTVISGLKKPILDQLQ